MFNEVIHFCEKEHRDIEKLFNDFLDHRSAGAEVVSQYFKKFKCSLHRHMRLEEEVFFAFYEKKIEDVDSGPTAAMRQEHDRMREILTAMQNKIKSGQATYDEELGLFCLFKNHGKKEDDVFFSVLEVVLSDLEKAQMIALMKEFPQKCCRLCMDPLSKH